MRAKTITAMLLAGACLLARGGEMKTLSFYNVVPTDRELTLDGKLDEPEWRNARAHSAYYEYWKPNPDAAKIATEYKMLHSKKGLYLAITNHDKNMAGLKANFTTRDASELWCDDCDEIYIDAFGDGVGYTKFTVNSIGTVGDMRQIDGSVALKEWSGSGWRCAVVRNKDSWVVEAFFPWDDLGNAAKEGMIWRFCNVRYAYTSGAFVGVTSSPGGNYQNTGGFGYLYFSGKKPLGVNDIGRIMSERVSPSWSILEGGDLITCEEKSKFKVEPVADRVRKEKESILKMTDETASILEKLKDDTPEKKSIQKSLSETKSALEGVRPEKAEPAENMASLRKLSSHGSSASDSHWLARTMELLENKI